MAVSDILYNIAIHPYITDSTDEEKEEKRTKSRREPLLLSSRRNYKPKMTTPSNRVTTVNCRWLGLVQSDLCELQKNAKFGSRPFSLARLAHFVHARNTAVQGGNQNTVVSTVSRFIELQSHFTGWWVRWPMWWYFKRARIWSDYTVRLSTKVTVCC